MREGNDVGSAAAAVAHHHRDGRLVSQALQGDGDDVGTSLHDQTHQGNALTQTWNTQPDVPSAVGGWQVEQQVEQVDGTERSQW